MNPSDLASFMDQVFKFQIGDVVAAKVYVDGILADAALNVRVDSYGGRTSWPHGLMVVGRVMEQCHGGVQLHYRISGLSAIDRGPVLTLFEFELVPFADAIEALKRVTKEPRKLA